MSETNDTKNSAFFEGLIGLAAAFFTIQSYISDDINKLLFVYLIIGFLLISITRVFGTILDVKRVNTLAEDLFKVIITPFTAYVFSRILLTEIYPILSIVNSVPFILGYVVFLKMLTSTWDVDLKLSFGVHRRKKE